MESKADVPHRERQKDAAQKPELLRISVVDAADRRAYEVELLEARRLAVKEQGASGSSPSTLDGASHPCCHRLPVLEAADYYNAASVDDLGGDSMTSSRSRVRHGASSWATFRARVSMPLW